MNDDAPLPSNRRTRPRGVPLLPPDIAEQAGPPPRRGQTSRPAPPELAASRRSAPRSDPAPRSLWSWRPRNPLAGRGPLLATVGRWLAGALLFFGLVGVASFGLYRYVGTSPRFVVKQIVVEGSAHRSQPDLARQAGVALGANIFSIDLEAARRGLLADPWIERATVDRKLPGSVTLMVVEREPLVLVSLGGSLFLAGRGGEIFKRLEAGDPVDLPVVTGLGGEGELVRDREGLVTSVRRAQEVAIDYTRIGPRAYALQEVHLTPDGHLELVVGRDGVRLALGKPPYRLKLERAARVLGEAERRRGVPSAIFLDNEAHPERVVARLR